MPKLTTKKQRNFAEKTINWLVFFFCYSPFLAFAEGWSTIVIDQARNIRIGLYAIAGVCGLITLLWSGIKWMLARSSGDHSHTFMDYLQQVGVLIFVGASCGLGASAWQLFGTGDPND